MVAELPFAAPWALLVNECQRGLLEKDLALFPVIHSHASHRADFARGDE